MKTIIFSLTTLLVLYNTLVISANPTTTNDKNTMTKSEARSGLTNETLILLAPVTPTEATFEDAESSPIIDNPALNLETIAPVTPKEAGFEDQLTSIFHGILNLFHSTPKEATFEDSVTN